MNPAAPVISIRMAAAKHAQGGLRLPVTAS